MAVTTKKKYIGARSDVEVVRRACGEVWTQLAQAFNYLWKEYRYRLSEGDAAALFATAANTKRVRQACGRLPFELDLAGCAQNPFVNHIMRRAGVQQRQQVVKRFYSHVDTFFQNLKHWKEGNGTGRPRPPYRWKRYYVAHWVHTRIKHEDGVLELGTPRGAKPIRIDWPHPKPQSLHITYQDGQQLAVATYDSEKQHLAGDFIRTRTPQGERTAGIDLGENYLAAAYDGANSLLIGGRKLKELRALQNSEKRWFSRRIDRKKRGSSRWRKLVDAKNKRLGEIRARIEDVMHKTTTRLVEELWSWGVSTVVVGDLTGIRDGMDYGKKMNQRLHQWAFRQFAEKLEYKAERYGMEVHFITERGTSKTCPSCGQRNATSTRQYRCTSCSFGAHRDMIGAANIRAKYRMPDAWASGHLEAVRTTAIGQPASAGGPKGAPSGRKTGRPTLWDQPAAVLKRSTLPLVSPIKVDYNPHMTCVISAQG